MPHDIFHLAGGRAATAVATLSVLSAFLMGAGLARPGDTPVYRSVDQHGNVVYTDRPNSADASKSTLAVHEPNADDLAYIEQQRKAAQAAETERLRSAIASGIAHAQQEKAQEEKQNRCDRAHNHYDSLQSAPRIYQLDAQGNRVYLSDAEAEAKRAEARQAVAEACES
jgi:hypothetical protein